MHARRNPNGPCIRANLFTFFIPTILMRHNIPALLLHQALTQRWQKSVESVSPQLLAFLAYLPHPPMQYPHPQVRPSKKCIILESCEYYLCSFTHVFPHQRSRPCPFLTSNSPPHHPTTSTTPSPPLLQVAAAVVVGAGVPWHRAGAGEPRTCC